MLMWVLPAAQAERDIVQRNSLDAARRNSFSADAEAQRADLRFPFQGAQLTSSCLFPL